MGAIEFDIIFISSINWDHIWQRPQQLATHFAKTGKRVLFIEPPYSLAKMVRNPLGIRSCREVGDGIFITQPKVLPLILDRKLNLNEWLYIMQLKHWIKKLELANPVIYSCFPYMFIPEHILGKFIFCYDVVDEISAFANVSKETCNRERDLIAKADLLFVTATQLFASKKELNPNIHLIPNGADIGHFSQAIEDVDREESEINGCKKPIIGYIGAIAEWIDYALIDQLAQRNIEWTFVFIGPIIDVPPPLPKNVKFLGKRPYERLPGLLKEFDVAIIPFKINLLTQNTNPIKLFEYLAAGKPVVSTALPEVKVYEPVISVAEDADTFEKCIMANLRNQSETDVTERQNIAKANSWAARSQKILSLIESLWEG